MVTATARAPGINPPACPTNAAAGYTPSDSHAAAGLTNFIVATNNDIGVYRKSDCFQTNFAPLTTFFKPGGVPLTRPSAILAFFSTALPVVTSLQPQAVLRQNPSFQYFAVSQDSIGGSWWIYRIVLSQGNHSFCKQAPSSLWDYPQAGNNIDRWFIAANDTPASSFQSNILSIGKATTLTGALTTVACFPGLQFNVVPPIVLDSDRGAVHISPGLFGGSTIKRYQINTSARTPRTDTLSTLPDVTILDWISPPPAPQPNGQKLNTLDGRFQSASIQSACQLWNVHAVDFNETGRSVVRLYKFSTAPANTSVQSLVTLQATNGNGYAPCYPHMAFLSQRMCYNFRVYG